MLLRPVDPGDISSLKWAWYKPAHGPFSLFPFPWFDGMQLRVCAPFQPSTLHSTNFLYILLVFRVSLSIWFHFFSHSVVISYFVFSCALWSSTCLLRELRGYLHNSLPSQLLICTEIMLVYYFFILRLKIWEGHQFLKACHLCRHGLPSPMGAR